MKIVYINPNATESMTRSIVTAAQQALPWVEISGLTNSEGPEAIQGAEDGDVALPGVLSRLKIAQAEGADAVVIACFDDTGLVEAQAQADIPVLGIGQSAYVMASLLGRRFSVVTSLAISIPVIDQNIDRLGYRAFTASVRASGLPVLTIDKGAPETIDKIAAEIESARSEDGATCVVLGCAGMAPLKPSLEARTDLLLIDGVEASAHLARAAAEFTGSATNKPRD